MNLHTVPRVSIIIPVYNGSDYIGQAVESALAQTYPNVEVLVVNDGSNDAGATERVARGFSNRIQYISKENGGVASALNLGIQSAEGEFISWLSHDDVYYPDKIERQMAVLRNQTAAAIAYSDYEQISAAGATLRLMRHPRPSGVLIARILLETFFINGCSLLIPKTCFKRVGYFDETLRTSQDYDMWFRLAREFPWVYAPGVVLKSRIHPGQGSRRLARFSRECDEIYIKWLNRLGVEEFTRPDVMPPAEFFFYAAQCLRRKAFSGASNWALRRAFEENRNHRGTLGTWKKIKGAALWMVNNASIIKNNLKSWYLER
jgi:hypothetical protein